MFKELYYWMYVQLKEIKTNDLPAFNAYLLICLLQGFNTLTIFVGINYFLKINVDRNTAIYFGLGLAVILSIINYFSLYSKREKFFKRFESFAEERKGKRLLIFWLYVTFSLVIFFVAAANLVSPKH